MIDLLAISDLRRMPFPQPLVKKRPKIFGGIFLCHLFKLRNAYALKLIRLQIIFQKLGKGFGTQSELQHIQYISAFVIEKSSIGLAVVDEVPQSGSQN